MLISFTPDLLAGYLSVSFIIIHFNCTNVYIILSIYAITHNFKKLEDVHHS